jgi:formyltetrahydrofolate deformylase
VAIEPCRLIVTVTCVDRTGLIHAISGLLATRGWNIDDSQQFADAATGSFFLRVEVSRAATDQEVAELRAALGNLASELEMDVRVHDRRERLRVMILVSRLGHCLNDLLYRWRTGALQAEVVAVVSNHPDLEHLAKAVDVPFHYLPVSSENRAEQEKEILSLVESLGVELVVLARYMQILTPGTVEQLNGRAINIHHSFLPSFKGANPYRQAYERGVKVIGATAHYVTTDLDEGPIIEQEVTRVDHRMSPTRLAAIGQDLECSALARAVGWHLEHRVFTNANRTVVFG